MQKKAVHLYVSRGFDHLKIGLIVLTLLASIGIQLIVALPAQASGEVFTGGSNVSGEIGSAKHITDLQVSGSGNPTVSLSLYVPSGTLEMTTTTGLTFTTSPTGSSLRFSGSLTDVNSALTTLQHTTSAVGAVTLEASLVGDGEVYYPENGHVYKVVSGECDEDVGPGCINWTDAQAAAAASSYQGLSGYLTTITTAEENAYIAARLTGGAAWIGASDAATEDDWRWINGPETGTSFYSGRGDISGAPVGGAYNNWNSGEPNDSPDEDCAEMYAGDSSGQWNDLHCSTSLLSSYIIEYGEDGDTPTIATKNITLTSSFPTGDAVEIDGCDDLLAIDNTIATQYNHYTQTKDIDCSNISNFTPIGNDTDGYNGDTFKGEYDGQGFTIRGIFMDAGSTNAGLFGQTQYANIHDIVLENGEVSGDSYTGSLVGFMQDTTLTNISSDFTIIGNSYVGGLVGYATITTSVNAPESLTYNGLVFTGSISADSVTGGLFGGNQVSEGHSITLTKSYTEGSIVAGSYYAGGLIGQLYVISDSFGGEAAIFNIDNSYSQSYVNAGIDSAGGLIGYSIVDNDGYDNVVTLNIDKTYSTGTVTAGNDGAGGLIGTNSSLYEDFITINIANSFVAGEVSALSNAYALIGGPLNITGSELNLTNNYFDQTRTGQADDVQSLATSTTAVSTDGSEPYYFINNTINPPLNTWDFDSVWLSHSNDFPTLLELSDLSDLNGDSIIDIDQPNVGGYVSPITHKTVAIDVGEGCELTTDDMTTEADLDVQDLAYEYDNGLWDFEADCGTPGFTTTIKLYYYNIDKSDLVLRKHNPTTRAFFNINDAVISTQTIGSQNVTVVTYQVTDGGERDTDGLVDGMIRDPAGLAKSVVGVPNTGL